MKKCTWLIGKSINVDIIWNSIPCKVIKNIELARNIDLFNQEDYKYSFIKQDKPFLKKTHTSWNSCVTIKGLSKVDKDIVHQDDQVINIDTMSKNDAFDYFIKINNIKLDNIEKEYIYKNITELVDLWRIMHLKNANISKDQWSIFLSTSKENWYKKLRDKSLLKEGVINDSIIPQMLYAINFKYKKPILSFINGKIKSGSKVWDLCKFWESSVIS